jgi:hypothetical protein
VGCGGDVYLTEEVTSGMISSPNFPSVPPPYTECEWFISAPQGKAIQLTFQIQFQFRTSARYKSLPCCTSFMVKTKRYGDVF